MSSTRKLLKNFNHKYFLKFKIIIKLGFGLIDFGKLIVLVLQLNSINKLVKH